MTFEPIERIGTSTKSPKVVLDFPAVTPVISRGDGTPTATVVTDVAARLRNTSIECSSDVNQTEWDFDCNFRLDGSSKMAINWYVPSSGGPTAIDVLLTTDPGFGFGTYVQFTCSRTSKYENNARTLESAGTVLIDTLDNALTDIDSLVPSDPENPSESLKDIIWNYGHRKRFKN